MDKEKLTEIAFGIIASAGEAKSLFMDSINDSENFKFTEAEEKIKKAREALASTHNLHYDVIIQESQGNDLNLSVLFIHAEDQFMSAETTGNMAEKFFSLYKLLKEKVNK